VQFKETRKSVPSFVFLKKTLHKLTSAWQPEAIKGNLTSKWP